MKILVFGNVGSGKTTILNELRKVFNFEVVAIDDYRRRYGDGREETELIAKDCFLNAIRLGKNQFIECIGLGKLADDLFELLSINNEKVICLTILTPKEICISRLKDRIWDIPFPEPIAKVSSLIDRTEMKIQGNEISKKWLHRKNTFLLSMNNTQQTNIDSIKAQIFVIIQQDNLIPHQGINDIEIMLDKSIQNYYGNEYLTYQKEIIERNDKLLEDRAMFDKFVSEANIQGNIIDIGSGSCQWFHLFEQKVNHYFAIDANSIALSLAPNNSKLTKINQDIFDRQFDLRPAIKNKIELAFFSFFFAHFSDASIQIVLEKLTNVNSLLILDSVWSDKHKEKYQTKDLKKVRRKISEKEHIDLPKRFFEYSDIDNLVKPFGYSITEFIEGNYWFACLAHKY